MLKKIALVLMFVLPVGAFAQTLKFAHVRSSEIIQAMPEYAKAQKDMEALQKKYSDEIQKAQQELQKKYTELMSQQDSLPQNILERRQKEIQDLAQRGEEFQQEVQQILSKAQNDMTAPIFKKLQDAINAVGSEGGYIYVFDLDRAGIPYVNETQSTNINATVKTKLGIK